jgi:hypothetical protein
VKEGLHTNLPSIQLTWITNSKNSFNICACSQNSCHTIVVQSDTWDKNPVKLKLAYKFVFELTQSMGLVLEHSKLEGFHFSQKHSDSNPDINLGYAPYTGATPLHPGTTW